MKTTHTKAKSGLLAAILIVGFCLRPSLTGIGSVLKIIRPELALSATASGLLTTLPMLTFAAFSTPASRLNDRIGTGSTLICGFLSILSGILLRSFGGLPGLFLGTVLIGVGICFGNTLMPAIIKEEYPARYGQVTALNSTMLAVSSGLASGINYPVAVRIGWRWGQCIWAGAALVGLLAWLPMRGVQVSAKKSAGQRRLLKNRVAWSVTLFLGISSLLFYSCMSWLATIFVDKGLDPATAGYFVSAFQLTGIVSSYTVTRLVTGKKDQRPVTFAVIGVFLAGILLILFSSAPALLLAGALLAGFACNGCFALSMAFIGFRAANSADTTALSSMSQTFGYLIAAVGPMGMGWLYSRFGSWDSNLWLIVAVLMVLLPVSNVCASDTTI